MLASRQGAGVFVTALDPDQSWEAVWQQADIVEVIEGRIAIETQAATLAALRREPRDLRSEGQTFCTVIVQDASPVRSKWVTG